MDRAIRDVETQAADFIGRPPICDHHSPGTVKAEMGAEVSQKWSWSYAFQSLLFFALSWSCVVGLAILILAHIQPLGDTFRFYAVLIAVLTWIAGVLGLPDIARLPLRPMLRRLYSRTSPKSDALSLLSRSRRVAWLFSLFLTLILVCSGVGVVIYCLSIRQYYSNLVHRALEETDPDAKKAEISEALSLLPWRKEAQILFESEAYGKRNAEDMNGFRNYIKTFATQQDVKLSIGRAPDADHLPLCLTKTASTNFLNDPVVWYASTIVEGEDESETLLSNEAVSMLATRKSPLAELQLWKMKLGQMMVGEPGDENEIATQVRELEIESTANQLRELLLKYNSSRGAQEYQAACDTLAGYFLRKCHLTAVGQGLEEAAYWFKEEISARQNQSTNSGAPLWLRPPDKLRLFYMFGSQWNMPGKAANDARCLLDARNCLKDPAKEPEPCDFAETFKRELWVPNWHYQDEPAWTRGTVRDHDLKLNQVIEDSLKKGWRY
jgi:hypothetical protein